MCYLWEESFKNKFGNLFKKNNEKDLKIIIGQNPYKQELNKKEFKVSSTNEPYCRLGNTVAFFVTDWIKIQDSLEMIFNLLFKGSVNSLKVLIYLRENNISANEFADYLYRNHKLVLTNIFINKDKDESKDSNIQRIKSFIKDNSNKDIYLLLVGEKATKILDVIDDEDVTGVVKFIHPSGQNLNKNKCQQVYFNNWYMFKIDDNEDDIDNNEKNSIIKKFILVN